jgi:hypothetical protein
MGRDSSPGLQPVYRLFLAIALGLFFPAVAGAQGPASGSPDEVELGRRIYLTGMNASGAEITGTRSAQGQVSGASAACVNCHRASGMGQVEADIIVPPITGNFLFSPRSDKQLATMDPRVGKLFNPAHDPYTDATLARAIRDGVNVGGREMNVLMPRYDLSDVELKAVTGYLKQLSAEWSPGAAQSTIRFATVITPEVDPARRQVFVDMIRTIVRQKNGSTVPATQGNTRRHMTSAAELVLGTERKWDLDIWELQGAPETWEAQLSERYRSRPVFALLSGLSDSTWEPMQHFCEHEHVPCWFPSVSAPGTSASPAYSFYFSGGVTLESAVLAHHLAHQKHPPKRVVQIYRDSAVGRAAARALAQSLAEAGIPVEDRVLKSDAAAADSLRQSLAGIRAEDATMFWLRPDDITTLEHLKPVPGGSYFSTVLSRGEPPPLPADWKAQASLVYLYDLPENRTHKLEYFHTWLNLRKIPLIDEVMQSEVYFALNFMTDTLAEMLANLYRDYLVERAETMLTQREGSKSEQEIRDRTALGREGDLARKHGAPTIEASARIKTIDAPGQLQDHKGTTIYPRLSLGPGQRFATKSGYIVRFANGSENRLIAETQLIVP